MVELRTTIVDSLDIGPLRLAAIDLQKTLSSQRALLSHSESDTFLCPVCQDGYLNTRVRGSYFGMIDDEWLECGRCNALFDKQLTDAKLVSAPADPFGVCARLRNTTLSLVKWREIAYARTRKQISETDQALSNLIAKIQTKLLVLLDNGTISPILTDVSSFVLRARERPVFAIHAEVIEQRKHKVTRRVTTGGGTRQFASVSLRVTKGVWFHTGGSAPLAPRQTYVETHETEEAFVSDLGALLVTNQRLTFKGERKRGFSLPLQKLAAIDADPTSGCLIVVPEGRLPVILRARPQLSISIGESFEVPLTLEPQWIANRIRNACRPPTSSP